MTESEWPLDKPEPLNEPNIEAFRAPKKESADSLISELLKKPRKTIFDR